MSEWITWQPCPRCGDRAALGWTSIIRADGGLDEDVPVEFDCSGGCQWDQSGFQRWARGEADERPKTTDPKEP